MGLGKKFSYKNTKADETTPGPGMYSNTEVNSIQMKMTRSVRNLKQPFGASKQ